MFVPTRTTAAGSTSILVYAALAIGHAQRRSRIHARNSSACCENQTLRKSSLCVGTTTLTDAPRSGPEWERRTGAFDCGGKERDRNPRARPLSASVRPLRPRLVGCGYRLILPTPVRMKRGQTLAVAGQTGSELSWEAGEGVHAARRSGGVRPAAARVPAMACAGSQAAGESESVVSPLVLRAARMR